jgi:hypothetical protein
MNLIFVFPEGSVVKPTLAALAGICLGLCGSNSGLAAPIVLGTSTSGQFDFEAANKPAAMPLSMSTLGAPVTGPASFGSDNGTYTFAAFNDSGVTPNLLAEGTGVCAGASPPCFAFIPPNTQTLTVTLGSGAATFTVTWDTVQADSTTPALTGTFDATSATGDLAMFETMGPVNGSVALGGGLTLAQLVTQGTSSEFGAFSGDLTPPAPAPASDTRARLFGSSRHRAGGRGVGPPSAPPDCGHLISP